MYDGCNMQIVDAQVTLLAVTRYARPSKCKSGTGGRRRLAGHRDPRETEEDTEGEVELVTPSDF